MIRRRVLLAALFLVLFTVGWWAGRGGASGGLYGRLDLFIEILHRVEQNYVDPVEPEKLVAGAMRGMLRDLDPYSQYLDRSAFGNLRTVTEGRFGGIGVVVGIRDGYPTVISPIEGSPAWQAGLHSGDVIVRIEGKPSAGLTVEEVAERLRGPEGTSVSLAVAREGEAEEQELTLERRIIVTKSVPYAFVAEPGVGYVRLANFSETSGAEVRAAVADLKRQGAHAFVLDLRMNPGGLLEQAVDVAEQFLPRNALVVYTKGRARDAEHRYTAADPRPDVTSPLVVLVDAGSASAAEIVAGALQDLDRALVMGRTSFGKGSVQTVFPLPNRTDAVKLTTALYHTASGRSIHRLTRHPALAADDADEDADEADAEARADSAAADSARAARPVFRTRAGRTVYGGGGITPDVEVRPDSLPPRVADVERRSLPFRFANRWVNTHPGLRAGAPLGEDARRAFAEFLRAEKAVADEAEWTAHAPAFERALRRELARRLAGDGGAARVALEGDAVARRALEVLRRARGVRDVFAGLAGGADSALAAVPAAPGTGR